MEVKWTLPIKSDWMKRNMVHEPTRQYAQEIYELVKLSNYKEALEIGSCWGVSALSILTAGEGHLTAVDSGKTHFLNETELNGFTERCTYHEMRSDNFWQNNKKKFDLIYIDGSHLYDDVKNDLFEAWKVVNPKGLLMWDDYDHPANRKVDLNQKFSEYGVSLASWEFIKANNITKIHTGARLLYIYKAEQ